jgi:hypothetical protein
MSRKIISAALALTVAGGVYLAAPSVEASNMGFKLERSFDLTREAGTGRPYLNLSLVSFPLFNGLADVADPNHSGGNKCVGDVGGPTAGNGFIEADDAICDLWTSRDGTFVFQKFDRDTCSYQARTATRGGITGIQFTGSFTYTTAAPNPNNLIANATGREIGYEVLISSSSMAVSPTNRGVIVGSHDPSFTGRAIVAAPALSCARSAAHLDINNHPYHSMYQRANEALCGLEGVDWVDVAAPIGDPDTCPNGTLAANAGIPFDGVHTLAVQTYDNDVAHGYVGRTVTINPITRNVAFTGNNFALRPGDAYILVINPDHVPTTYLEPHF